MKKNDSKVSLKASSTSKIDDYASSETTSIILNDERERKNSINYSRRNVYEDFKESMATIASKRRVSSDKLLSKTFSQNTYQKGSKQETPLTNYYRNVITSTKTEKLSYYEKNNKNLKNMHKNFNLKIDMEANDINRNHKKSLFQEKKFMDNTNGNNYIKSEPCYISSKKETTNIDENNKHQILQKYKKKNRINKVYSMQPTINDHIKSKLDHITGSNIGTTEEEFESDEISEGNINLDENNRIEKLEISEGVVYGQGGIPVRNFESDIENLKNLGNLGNLQNLNSEKEIIKNVCIIKNQVNIFKTLLKRDFSYQKQYPLKT